MTRSLSPVSFFGAFLMFQAPQPAPINKEKPLDVCTVLGNLQEYRNKVVSIRGEWDGPDIAAECVNNTARKTQFGVPYLQNRILKRHPFEDGLDGLGDLSQDEKAVESAMTEYLQLIRQGHDVLATFTGRLEARAVPWQFEFGYGHLGAYQAQLVLITIQDVVSRTGKPIRKPLEDKDFISIDR